MREPINFLKLNDALLSRAEYWVSAWLPSGHERSDRWYVGDFDGSKGESANVCLKTGKWIDNAFPDDDCGGDLVSLYARVRGLKQGEAALELMDQLGWRRPEHVQTPAPTAPHRSAAPEKTARETMAGADSGEDTRPEPPPVQGVADGAEPSRARSQPKWQPVVPVPAHAPPCVFEHGYRDKKAGAWVTLKAVAHWRYEFDGVYYGHVARYERLNSEGVRVKDTIAHTWCENTEDGRGLQRWHAKQWEDPRPLYVPATLLSGDGKLPVVIVEGEKCAMAGLKLVGHEFDFVSWPGGCAAWAKAAWHWLRGRTVYLWADCDAQHEPLTKAERDAGTDPKTKPLRPAARQPGVKAMQGIGTLLQAEMGCQVHWVPIPAPGAVPEGWDLADAVAEGWDAARVRDFIRSAVPFEAGSDEARAKAKVQQQTAAEEVVSWRSALFYSSTGAIKACRENLVVALDGVPELGIAGDSRAAGVISFNSFTNNVEKRKAAPWGTPAGEWLEHDELEMGAWLSRELYLPPMPRGTLEEAVQMVARRHGHHPAREEVEACRGTWDGEKRLGSWLRRVCMKPGTPADEALDAYLSRAGGWFIMGMCARVLPELYKGPVLVHGPGCKFDYMLVFEGPQGYRKSTLAAALGGAYFADTGLNLDNKDSYQNIQGVLVYEFGEMQGLSKSDVRLVKLFVASPKDRFRATYDRRPRDYPRQCVFVGTTNEAHYLTDSTGNRRFWPVKLERPADIEWLRANRAQLMAEALVYLDAGYRFHPTAREQAEIFDPQQNLRRVDDTLENAVRIFLYEEGQKVGLGQTPGHLLNQMTMNTLLDRIGLTLDKQTAVVTRAAGSILSQLGWVKQRASADADGKRPWVYVRPKEPRRAPDDTEYVGDIPFQANGVMPSINAPSAGDATEGDPDGAPF